jgi:hypothetical protein
MGRWEQYEIWLCANDKWHLAASFADIELAKAIAGNYTSNMRLVHATYEGSRCEQQDVLMDLGATRKSA